MCFLFTEEVKMESPFWLIQVANSSEDHMPAEPMLFLAALHGKLWVLFCHICSLKYILLQMSLFHLVFFSWAGLIGEKGVDFEYCLALQKHIIMGEKKFSPLGLKQYFQLLCIFPDPYTVSKRNDFFCRCWKEYTHKRLWGLLWKNREMGHTDVPQTNGAEK